MEALQTDKGWLKYWLRAMQDALLDQHALTAEGTTTVDRVKTVLLKKEGALAMVNGELQKAHAALAEAQTVVAEKETALASAQSQLQQDRTTLEGARSWQAQAE
jgi:Zn-dependent metalloprotease